MQTRSATVGQGVEEGGTRIFYSPYPRGATAGGSVILLQVIKAAGALGETPGHPEGDGGPQ